MLSSKFEQFVQIFAISRWTIYGRRMLYNLCGGRQKSYLAAARREELSGSRQKEVRVFRADQNT